MNIDRFAGVIPLVMGMLASACVSVDGGAVEASWDLRFADGRRVDDNGQLVDCLKEDLARMQFSLISKASGQDPCAGEDHCKFNCSSFGSGTTNFAIPEDRYAISIQIVDTKGQILGPAEGVVTPGPVVRWVRVGQITDLNVNLIIVDRN